MKREEAIKVVIEMHGWLQTDREREALETLIPELRESEDERIRKKLYNTVMGTPNDSTWFDGTSKEAMLAWLEKQKAQKQEWNEEDEKVVKSIINYLSYDGTQAILTEEIDEWIAWLKSLRPSWKPREEQMEALENSTALTEEQGAALYSLIQDLKKL